MVVPQPRSVRSFLFIALCVGSVASLYAQDVGELTIRTSPVTGLASFVTAADGGAMAVTARDFLIAHGHRFGVTDPGQELVPVRTETDAIGYTHTTYEQVYQGLRVFSGVLKVHQDPQGEVIAANGDFYPISPKLVVVPTLASVDAESIARAVVEDGGCFANTLPALEAPRRLLTPGGVLGPWRVARSSGVPAHRHGAGPCDGEPEIDHGPGTILTDGSGTVPPSPTPYTLGVKGGLKPAARSELVIVDPGWYGDPVIGPHLAYYIILEDPAARLGEAFFVDAHDGAVLDRWSTVCQAMDRSVHDAGETPELPGPLARAEGDPPTGDANVDAAYDYLGDTYAYFFQAFARDGMDDQGGTIVATVHSSAPRCPNASWSFTLQQIFFCTNTTADDIVAHEMAHGVTQYTANLIYQNQSGQLNESFSDVFGELVDLLNGNASFVGPPGGPPPWPTHPSGPGTDTPNNLRSACSPKSSYPNGVRWLFGEDADAAPPFDGAFRDLWDPTCFGHPDRANSPLQTCDLGDNGGVHSGSGIPNHGFAMLVDGKNFNGYTVNGLGPIKAAAVWYRALTTYLTVAADFQDAYTAFNQAAADLVGTYPFDPRTGLPSDSLFTAADAAEVDKALRAVEMDTPGACGQTVPVLAPEPPLECSGRVTLFADDFEDGINGWTVWNSGPPTPYDWVQTTSPLPFQRPGVAWECADPNIGDCSTNGTPEQGIHSLFSPVLGLPAEVKFPALRFAHFVETEPRWDGGLVKISVNGGPWQFVPRAAFRHNSYNTTLFAVLQGSTNPCAGEIAFSGVGGEWGTSLIDLSTFVTGGDTLQVRFDFAKDWCFGFTGWFLDDFEVYHCPQSTDCNSNGVPDDVDLLPGAHREVRVRQPPNHSSGNASDFDDAGLGVMAVADNFQVLRPQTVAAIKLWGGYYPSNSTPNDLFTVLIHADTGGFPGPVIYAESDVPSSRVRTGNVFLVQKVDEWEYTLNLRTPFVLEPGGYFIEILNNTVGNPDTFFWQRALVGDIPGAMLAYEAPGMSWTHNTLVNFSLELLTPVVGYECNSNGLPDECEALPDCNTNGIPDLCGPCGDHNGDGNTDLTDLAVLVNGLTGPGGSPAECLCQLDADLDGDLDLADFAAFQRCGH